MLRETSAYLNSSVRAKTLFLSLSFSLLHLGVVGGPHFLGAGPIESIHRLVVTVQQLGHSRVGQQLQLTRSLGLVQHTISVPVVFVRQKNLSLLLTHEGLRCFSDVSYVLVPTSYRYVGGQAIFPETKNRVSNFFSLIFLFCLLQTR